MNYLYHRVPKDMRGTTIFPGNALVEKYSDLITVMEKYKNRSHLVQSIIPDLNCLWNDVIFLSATHPKKIQEALIATGGTYIPSRYFCIDPTTLEPENTRIYHSREKGMSPKNFEPYSCSDIDKYDHVPNETLDYYREQFNAGNKPLMYHHIPHIIYKGTIETKNLEIITI